MRLNMLPLIEAHRASRLLVVRRKGNLEIVGAPPRSSSGFYWILTDYSLAELKGGVHSQDPGAINIGLLAALHEGLPHVCTLKADGFRLVYNGIAGPSCGLRERLHQHFHGGVGTGCLSIWRSSLSDLSRWRVSFATVKHRSELAPDVDCDYITHAMDIERLWRLRYGWSLLCRI